MTTTLCLSGAVVLKAGNFVSTALTDSNYTMLINQAESFIAASTRTDWVSLYSTLNTDKKKILEDAASSHAAVSAIAFNLSLYPTTAQAQTMLNVNYARLFDCIQLLKEEAVYDFIKGT